MTPEKKEEQMALRYGNYAARTMSAAFWPLQSVADDLERLGVQPDAVRAIRVVLGFKDSVVHMSQALIKGSIPEQHEDH